jgi:hypothetical protein
MVMELDSPYLYDNMLDKTVTKHCTAKHAKMGADKTSCCLETCMWPAAV